MMALNLRGLEKHLMVKGIVSLFGQCDLEQMMARTSNWYLFNNSQNRKSKEPCRIILQCKIQCIC